MPEKYKLNHPKTKNKWATRYCNGIIFNIGFNYIYINLVKINLIFVKNYKKIRGIATKTNNLVAMTVVSPLDQANE